MEIRLRAIRRENEEHFKICKPIKFVEWEGLKFYYVKCEFDNCVKIIEESTGRAVVGLASTIGLATREFNRLTLRKSKKDFLEAIEKCRKAPIIHELI